MFLYYVGIQSNVIRYDNHVPTLTNERVTK